MNKISRRSIISTAAIGLAAILPTLASAENGVTASAVKIGMSIPQSGSNKATGDAMFGGVNAYVTAVNAAGGVNGRKIELVVYDDAYDAAKTTENLKTLNEKDKVFAITSLVGTNAAFMSMPYLLKESLPLIGAGTGGEFLRVPLKKSIFTIRQGYYNEIDALVDRLSKDFGYKKFALLGQNDTLGDTGRTGFERALLRRSLKSVAVVTYDKTKPSDMSDAVEKIKNSGADVVIMAAVPAATSAFVSKMHESKVNIKMAGISSIRTSFMKDLKPEVTNGLLMSNIMPEPTMTSLPIIAKYRTDMEKIGIKEFSSASVEGYANAVAMVEGLKGAGGNLTRDSFIKAMESIDKDVGGIKFSYSDKNHGAMNDVFFLKADGGKFSPVESFK